MRELVNDDRIDIRLSSEEKTQIKAKAVKAGYTRGISRFVVDKLLDRMPHIGDSEQLDEINGSEEGEGK